MAKLPTVTGSCAKNAPHHLPLQPLQRGQPSAAHRHLHQQTLDPQLSSSSGPALSHHSLWVQLTQRCGVGGLCCASAVHIHGLAGTGGGTAGGDNGGDCGVACPRAGGVRVRPGAGIPASLASGPPLLHDEAQLLHFGPHGLVLIPWICE